MGSPHSLEQEHVAKLGDISVIKQEELHQKQPEIKRESRMSVDFTNYDNPNFVRSNYYYLTNENEFYDKVNVPNPFHSSPSVELQPILIPFDNKIMNNNNFNSSGSNVTKNEGNFLINNNNNYEKNLSSDKKEVEINRYVFFLLH